MSLSKRSLKIIGIVVGVAVIISIVALLVSGGDKDKTVTLDDGASISIPSGAVSSDASVTATVLAPENGPEVPDGFTTETLYEFSVGEPLSEPVTLRLPLASVTDDSVLWVAKYDEASEEWHGVEFTEEDGYAVIEANTLSIYGTIKGTWDDLANWAIKAYGSVYEWERNEILPRLTLDHWISRFEEIVGLDKTLDEDLFDTSYLFEYDDSSSKGLIAASARVDDTVEIRIENKTRMYLHLYFEGPSVEPVRGGYITLQDILELVDPTPGLASMVQDSFVTNSIILIPESSADFHVDMNFGDTLQINAELSYACGLLQCLDPFFSLVPIVDLEVITAYRDLEAAPSQFFDELLDFESRWFEKVDAGLSLSEAAWRAGWKLTMGALKTTANGALLCAPAYTDLADKQLGSVEDIWNKGDDAIDGATLVFVYGEEDPGEGRYRLTIHSSNGGSITAPGEGSFIYDAGTEVDLIATPDSGYRFVNWVGDTDTADDVNAASITVTMNDDYAIMANFGETTEEFSLTVSSTVGGSVTIPGQGTFTYDAGTEVDLVATPDSGYQFVSWTGDTDTISNVNAASTTISMNDSYAITANFEEESDEPEHNLTMVATGNYHTVGLKSDHTVVAVGRNVERQCNVDGWTSIVQVAAGNHHTVGLKSDGTVVATGAVGYDYGQCNVGGWADIVQVAAGFGHTVGLKSDGTVVAVGRNSDGQCNVGSWTNIVQVAAGSYHTIGLKSDHTVVAVGRNNNGQCNVDGWTGIVQVAAGNWYTVGVESDGTVEAVGWNEFGQCDVGGWTGIVQVAADSRVTVGVESDGTVVAVGWNDEGQCNVGSWTNIIQAAVGAYHTVGLKSDGTVVAVGNNDYGQCNVEG